MLDYDTIPPIPAEDGAPVARWVLDIITAHPEVHEQLDFERKTGCGTVRCIAGWVNWGDGRNADDIANAGRRLAIADKSVKGRCGCGSMGCYVDADSRLFYYSTNEEAVTILRDIAEGRL